MLDPETLRGKRQESLEGLFLNGEFTVKGTIFCGVYDWDLRKYWVEALERMPSSNLMWKKRKGKKKHYLMICVFDMIFSRSQGQCVFKSDGRGRI